MPRKIPETVSPEILENIAKHIGETGVLLKEIAESMRQDRFDEMQVSSWDQMSRAMKYMDNFLSAARGGLLDARTARGDLPKNNKAKAK